MISGIKENLISQESMDHTKEFMGNDENCLFVPFSLSSFFRVKGLEDRIDSYDCDSHQEDHPTQAFISSFGDVTSAFPLSGFVDCGIEASISDKLLWCREGTVLGFGQEMGDGSCAEAGDRAKDSQGAGNLVAATVEKAFCHLFEFLLQALKDADFRAQDGFEVLRGEADGSPSHLDQDLGREPGLAATTCAGQDVEKGLRRSLKESILGGEGGQQTKRGCGEGVKDSEDLGENDGQISFDFVFESHNLRRDIFTLPSESSKFIDGWVGLGQGLGVGPEELGDDHGVPLIGLCLSQRELDEVRDKQWVEHADIKAMSLKEGEQVQVIGAGRLHPDPKRMGRRTPRSQGAQEIAESIGGHEERLRPKELPLVIDQGGMEAVFGDIDTAEMDRHGFTSGSIIRIEAGDASRPILHSDEGSWTQSTYKDCGWQRTDSFEGSRAQEIWSSPASSLLSYQAYNNINNINYL